MLDKKHSNEIEIDHLGRIIINNPNLIDKVAGASHDFGHDTLDAACNNNGGCSNSGC